MCSYIGVELLCHMVTLSLTVSGPVRLFSKSRYTIVHSHEQCILSFLHPHQHIVIAFLIIVTLLGVKWHLTVVLIYIFLMAIDVEYLFLCSMDRKIHISSLENYLFRLLAHF